ncbi:porin family protein [Rheinheimera soli]|uniref:porin family protein n=1 Tax=Rheinheimera soli TaxID=443616 RepID=UPI001E36EA93|nr:porin family protein [Rheinheimera soli]
MLKKIAVALMGLGCSAAVFSAQAEQPLYFGAQYSQQSVDDLSWDFGVLSAVAGYKFNDVFAIEGRFGLGIQDEEYSSALTSAKVGVDHSYSILGKASWPMLETLSVYGIAGFNKTKYDFKVNDGDTLRDDYSEDGLIYGAGAELHLTSNLSLNLEYAVLPEIGDDDEDNLDVESISAGINYRF